MNTFLYVEMCFLLLLSLIGLVVGQNWTSSSIPPRGNVIAHWNWPVVSNRECILGSKTGRTAGKGLKMKVFLTPLSTLADQEFYNQCVNECNARPWCMAVETTRSVMKIPVYHQCKLVTAVEVLRALGYLDDAVFFLSVRTLGQNGGSYPLKHTITYKGFEWQYQGYNEMEVGQLPHTLETWTDGSTQWNDDDVMCIARAFFDDSLSDFDSEGAGANTGPAPSGRFTDPPVVATQPPTAPVKTITPRTTAWIAAGGAVVVTFLGVICLLGGDNYNKVEND